MVDQARILVVDDELSIVRLCVGALTRQGYQVQGVGRGQEALALLEKEHFDLLLLDLMMPDVDGLTVLRRARELDPDVAAIIITGYGTLENAIDALRAGTQDFVLKPFTPGDLLPVVAQALEKQRQEQENLLLRARLPILEISQVLVAGEDAVSLIQRLLEVVMRQVDADRASLMLLDKQENELHIAAAIGLPAEVVDTTRVLVGQGIAGRALLREDPLVLDEGANLEPSLRALMVRPDIVAAVCAPLRTRKKTIGVLNVSRLTGGKPFTPSNVNLLSVMGNSIATALDNAGLYEEIRNARDYFRTVLDSLHDEVMVVDRYHVITDANAAFLRKTGYQREEVIGQHCYRVSHQQDEPCHSPEHPCPVAEVWRTGRPARGLHIHLDRAGKRTYIDIVASPLHDERGQVTQVIEALRDVTTEWELERKLGAIHALARELVFIRDETQIAQLVVNTAEHVLEFQTCDLLLVDQATNTLVHRMASSGKAKSKIPIPLDSERGIVAAVARSGEPIYLHDVSLDPRYVQGHRASRSEFCVPLKVGDRVIGVLNAESESLDAFDEADQQLFSTLADQAALALENAQLYLEVQHHMEEMLLTNKVGQAVTSSLELEQILTTVMEETGRVLATGINSLLLLDEESGELIFEAAVGPQSGKLSGLRLAPGQGIAGWVAREGQPLLVPDVRKDPRFYSGVDTIIGSATRSILCVPLEVKGKVIGVIEAVNKIEGEFGQRDVELLSSIAQSAAIAIENARLFEIVAQGKREWETTFDAIADGIFVHDADFRILRVNRTLARWLGTTPQALIGRTCYEAIHYADAPLEICINLEAMQRERPHSTEMELPELGGTFLVSAYPLRDERGAVTAAVQVLKNITEQKRVQAHLIQTEKLAALGRLAASLAHEINNPLQALHSGLRLLVGRPLDKKKQQRYLEIANHEVERLIAIVERMLNFYRPAAERPEPTDVHAVVNETLALAGKQLQHSRVTVQRQFAAELPMVQAVAGQLRQVFLNIIINALDAMPKGGKLTVETGWNGGSREVWVSFTDTGEGVPAEEIPRIFEPFYTRKLKGTGLGLSISYSIMERHGGRIEVESQVGEGSTFTVWLPVDFDRRDVVD